MKRRTIELWEAAEMVEQLSPELVKCRIENPKGLGFYYEEEANEYHAYDWIEWEGAPELVTDESGNILRYDGYFLCCDEEGNWTW